MTQVYRLDPLVDDRWDLFLQGHPNASIFHTAGWLRALHRTYGYGAVVYTTAPPGRALTDGIPFCLVDSWLTGRRLVSVPFSDHCEPLADRSEDLVHLLKAAEQDCQNQGRAWMEIRPLEVRPEYQIALKACGVHRRYFHHRIDLTDELDALLGRFHKTAIRQPIHRAERDGVQAEEGTSDGLLDEFYRLMVITRRKHGVPPQPRQWFRGLLDCLGDHARLYVARKDDRPIAAIFTCRWGTTATYKYSVSDQESNRFGGTPLLIWKSLQAAKASGARTYDMGRTDVGHESLGVFKERWGAVRTELAYLRSPMRRSAPPQTKEHWGSSLVGAAVRWSPDRVCVWMGQMLYRHMG
jgi:CelD/BcsL family acetyltransferase involved in cellulose biosynthesis